MKKKKRIFNVLFAIEKNRIYNLLKCVSIGTAEL